MRRYELSDEQYQVIEPLLPKSGGVGRPWANHRQVLNGLFWKLCSGASWRDIPERYGPWQTIYERYTAWRQDGTWERIVQILTSSQDLHDKATATVEEHRLDVDAFAITDNLYCGQQWRGSLLNSRLNYHFTMCKSDCHRLPVAVGCRREILNPNRRGCAVGD